MCRDVLVDGYAQSLFDGAGGGVDAQRVVGRVAERGPEDRDRGEGRVLLVEAPAGSGSQAEELARRDGVFQLLDAEQLELGPEVVGVPDGPQQVAAFYDVASRDEREMRVRRAYELVARFLSSLQ